MVSADKDTFQIRVSVGLEFVFGQLFNRFRCDVGTQYIQVRSLKDQEI